MLRFVKRDTRAFDASAREALRPYAGITAQLLYSRGISSAAGADDFLNPSLSRLHDPMLMSGMARAVELITEARDNCHNTVVYGDYDVDGMCATALMTLALRRFGIDAQTYTPLREEGYGLNENAVKALANDGCKLLVTVDLGITNHDEVRLAQKLGMRVIVTDHHGLPLTPCPADAALNPLLGDYPFRRLCGAGVAFKVAQALLGLDNCIDFIDLAALATVADIVPLVDENRAIVAHGLPIIAEGRRAGIAALLEVSGVAGDVDTDTLGYRLAPRLNAAGRLEDAGDGVRLLMCEDASEAREAANKLDELNTQRKSKEGALTAAAYLQALEHDFVEKPLLIARGEDWHEGVIGLAAGRLCQQYYCPTCVLSERDGLLRGSLRSVPGVHIHRCLQTCDDLLMRYGGHELAAGVTLKTKNFDEFERRMQAEVSKSSPETFIPAQVYDAEAELEELADALLDEMSRLAPFGCENPAPLLMTRGLQVEEMRAVGANGAHLKLTLRQGGIVIGAIAFSMGNLASRLPQTVDAVYSLGRNTFRGVTSLQLEVKALRPAQNGAHPQPRGDDRGAVIDALCDMAAKADADAGNGDTRAEYNWLALLSDWTELEAELNEQKRGVLLMARTKATAERAMALADLDLCEYAPDDCRCFNTLCMYPSMNDISGHWRQVWLLDGELCEGETEAWLERLPEAELHVIGDNSELARLALSLDAGDERYRVLFRELRGKVLRTLREAAEASGLDEAQTRLGLLAFSQLKLIRYSESPFSYALLPASKCSLADSPALKAIRTLAQSGRAM